MAVKRLMQEFKELVGNPTEGVVAGPSGEDSFFEWDAMVLGPQDTPFADGCFEWSAGSRQRGPSGPSPTHRGLWLAAGTGSNGMPLVLAMRATSECQGATRR